MGTMVNRWCLLSIVGMLVILLGACGGDNSDSKSPNGNTSGETTGGAITAGDLHSAYSSNEIAADQEFTGRNVKVAGTVSLKTGRDIIGTLDYVITLEDKVRCEFDSINKGQVLNVARNQQVVVEGRVVGVELRPGFRNEHIVDMEGCRIREIRETSREDVVATFQAPQLYNQHMAAQEATNARFGGQVVQIEGIIAAIGNLDDWVSGNNVVLSHYVTLESEGNWDVACIFPTTQRSQITGLARGQRVILLGRYDIGRQNGVPTKGTSSPSGLVLSKMVPSFLLRNCTVQ